MKYPIGTHLVYNKGKGSPRCKVIGYECDRYIVKWLTVHTGTGKVLESQLRIANERDEKMSIFTRFINLFK